MIDGDLVKLMHDLMGHNILYLTTEKAPKEAKWTPKPHYSKHRVCCVSGYGYYVALQFEHQSGILDSDPKVPSHMFIVYSEMYDNIPAMLYLLAGTGPGKKLFDRLMVHTQQWIKDNNSNALTGYYGYDIGHVYVGDTIKLPVSRYHTGVFGNVNRYDWDEKETVPFLKRQHMKQYSSDLLLTVYPGTEVKLWLMFTKHLPGDIILNGAKFNIDVWFDWLDVQNEMAFPQINLAPQPLAMSGMMGYTNDHNLQSLSLGTLKHHHEQSQNLCQLCKEQTPLFSDSEEGHLRILKVVQ